MSATLHAIRKWASLQPHAIAVRGPALSLEYKELSDAVNELQDYLLQAQPAVVALLMDNSPAWVIVDLAAQSAGIPLLPLPGFFSDQQIRHALQETGCDYILTDKPERFNFLGDSQSAVHDKLSGLLDTQDRVWELHLNSCTQSTVQTSIAKITYTSGTTGTPRGVCLQQATIDTVALSLRDTADMQRSDKHFCALPLATLLENIAGVYLPLLSGAQTVVYPMHRTGLQGATAFDASSFSRTLAETRASTTVLVPHLLQKFVEHCEQKNVLLPMLRFIAVGGAPVSLELLERARFRCLPVFEGYGLSECASVVAVNSPQQHRPGSVGKPLPHVNIKIADDGEILVQGACHSGYLGEAVEQDEYLATGDVGYIDQDGYLYLSGRKKNMFITAYGRNVSPEWVERELVLQDAIEQAAIFGEARPWNVALIVPSADCTDTEIFRAIERVNAGLPDYARVTNWLVASGAFQVANQQLTATGRLRRDAIWQYYADKIETLYSGNITPHRKLA